MRRFLRIRLGLLLSALLIVCPVAYASPSITKSSAQPPSALALYRLSFDVDAHFSYTGHQFLTVWRDDDSTEATATIVSHRAPSDTHIAYTAPRQRRGTVIIQSEQQEWTYIPSRNIVIHGSAAHEDEAPEQSSQFKLLLTNYRLTVAKKPSVIVGRKAYEVSLMPYAVGRPYDRLWIDPYTGLVLRREKYHSDHSLASVSYYSDIHYHPKFTAQLFSAQALGVYHARVVEQPSMMEKQVLSSALPKPFNKTGVIPRNLKGFVLQKITQFSTGKNASLHLLYTDGLNALSLFETVRNSTKPTRVPSSRMTILSSGLTARVSQRYAYSILSWDTPPLNFTLVGDISVKMLRGLAQAAEDAGARPPSRPIKHGH